MVIAEARTCFIGSEEDMPIRIRGECDSSATFQRSFIPAC